jgi:hypothetical protein
VSFHVTDDQVAAGFRLALRGLQHGVGFTDTGAHAEKNLEAAAFTLRGIALERGQQGIGTWARRLGHGDNLINLAGYSVKNFARKNWLDLPSKHKPSLQRQVVRIINFSAQ